ncbi:MAG: GNAT family protein [Candidatus Gracilibacteria bacterium]|nr:GNAT family protein [Candidatus Gracilibacteria bacterium]
MFRLPIDYKIETQRCIIEMPKIENAKEYFSLVDDDISKFMTWGRLEDVKAYEEFIDKKRVDWENQRGFEAIVKLKETGEMIGCFGIVEYFEKNKSVEIGYWLGKKYWGNGIIPECVEKMKEISFDVIGAEKVIITTIKENMNSRRVAEKSGFKLDGILRNDMYVKGAFFDKVVYSFLREEYLDM